MEGFLSDPSTLAVMAFIAAHSLMYLVGGIRQRHADITAWSRIGMGTGMLLATGGVMVALSSASANVHLIPLTPPIILAITTLLQGYVFGMACGLVFGLFIGISRLGLASTQAAAPARPAVKLADYRVLQVAVLPGALLLADVAVVGGLDLLFLRQFTRAELWCLAVFPGLLLVICLLSEWFIRHLARLPLRLPDDPAQDGRAENRFRARLVGLVLEREIFALFLLVACQWLLQNFSQAHPNDLLYTGALPVLAVVLLSMRGLLERAQRELHHPPTKPAAPLLSEPDRESEVSL